MTILFVLILVAAFCGLITLLDNRSANRADIATYMRTEYNFGDANVRPMAFESYHL